MDPLPGDIYMYGGSKHEGLSARIIDAGEILLTGDDSEIQYSHTSLHEARGLQCEAVWPVITRSKVDYSRTFKVLRYEGITYDQRMAIMDTARLRLGQWYDLVYIITFGLLRWSTLVRILTFGIIQPPPSEVCCLYIGDCYAAAGLQLSSATPNDLEDDPHLTVIQKWSPE